MNSRVRLLPVIAAVAFGAFAVKAVSIAEAAGAASKSEAQTGQNPPAPEQTSAAEQVQGSGFPAPVTEGEDENETCAAPDFLAEQAGLSQYEIQVLRSLAERRDALNEREEMLDTRELTVSAAELRLNDQIDELKSLETNIQQLLTRLDNKNDEQLASLVKVYESMKPKDAARIFDSLEDDLMLQLADRMKPAYTAAILSYMSPDRARTLTQLMAKKTEPPTTVSELEARTDGL